MSIDTSKSVFVKTWGENGYSESWEGYRSRGFMQSFDDVMAVVEKFLKPEMVCVELGTGAGDWTRRLVRRCAELIGLDVLEYAPFCHPNFRYVEVPDRNFECHSVQPNSVDFVFSFGLFCHLSCDAQRAYLKSIHRVLKPNGSAVICFANFQRHPGLKSHNLQRCKNVRLEEPKGPDTDTVWFYNDLEETRNMVAEAGFVDFVDELPAFRDTLASFRKPV